MASVVIGAIGAAIGAAVLPAGVTILGTAIAGAAIGQAIGTAVGSYIDAQLFLSSGQSDIAEGPRLNDLQVLTSTDGISIPKLYGRVRVGGQVIWATQLEEVKRVTKKGGIFGIGDAKIVSYDYYANLAVALCEGPISEVTRIWADGKEIDMSDFTIRIYTGTETQDPDSLIVSKEGSDDDVPAYRGTAYVVFDRIPLEDFFNRVPQFNFEVIKPADPILSEIKAVTMIPAAGEFVYSPFRFGSNTAVGGLISAYLSGENVHSFSGKPDWEASVDNLQATVTGVNSVSLFTAWFGSDLRCGNCEIKPKVDNKQKNTFSLDDAFSAGWAAAGLTRDTADLVSQVDGGPAFGGTPADVTISAALEDLHSRGLQSILTPFMLMDIAEGNSLPDPYSSSGGFQQKYPWRGRITCAPAPGVSGTVDQTATAATQIDTFYGTVTASDFSVDANGVTYTGPTDEWSYSRFILHHAALAAVAEIGSGQAVSAFAIGSEMRYLTVVRDTSGASFPFVDKLIALAAQVKILLPNTDVTYASDWSEFVPFQTSQFGGTDGEIFFHLDDLWSDSNIDAIGIDNYWPLSDWREGVDHLDYSAGYTSIYDLDYLKGNIEGGEGYDFFYASDADRNNQVRTTITDGLGKPWVFRFKDIKNWWLSEHYNRPGAVEDGSPTSWVPESKQIWFTETGCPAVDKGPNQPNVFYDPKSSESAVPYFSLGIRDDFAQRAYIQSMVEWYDVNHTDYIADSNPFSTTFSHLMVDINRIMIYTWDARPYPHFPNSSNIWSDAPNWTLGHWITGRFNDVTLPGVIESIFQDYGFSDYRTPEVFGTLAGFMIDRTMSVREALQPLETAYLFDTWESGGQILTRSRAIAPQVASVDYDDLIDSGPDRPRSSIVRVQETDLPSRAKMTFIDPENDYNAYTVEAVRIASESTRVAGATVPIAIRYAQGNELVSKLLFEQWGSRERISFALPPSYLKVDPGDLISLTTDARSVLGRVTNIRMSDSLLIESLGFDPTVYGVVPVTDLVVALPNPDLFTVPIVAFMDLPVIGNSLDQIPGFVGAFQSPFNGVDFYRSPDGLSYELNTQLVGETTMGDSLTDLYSGPTAVFDKANVLQVRIHNDDVELATVSELALFDGSNTLAIENSSGVWEVIQFKDVELVSSGIYNLSNLLRGQFGTEDAMEDPIPSGATVIVLDGNIVPVSMTVNDIDTLLFWKYGPTTKPISDNSYGSTTHAFTGRGLRPFSPVHVEGVFSGTDLNISWIRRTRFGGDRWDATSIPLNEETEAYEIDILNGSTVVRTLTASTASVTYTTAQQIADWGSVQSSYTIDVYQLSAIVDRGTPRRAVIP